MLCYVGVDAVFGRIIQQQLQHLMCFISVVFLENPAVEIDETTPVQPFVFEVTLKELSHEYFYNSHLLLKVDNKEKGIAHDEIDNLQLIERLFCASNKD